MIEPLEARLSGLLHALEPAQRKALARELGRRLRASQSARIAAQTNPDGTPFAPRKPRLRDKKKGRLRAMFGKLRTARYLKIEATADAAALSFADKAQRIARVHQLGLRDRVERSAGAPVVQYPARELLGFTKEDRSTVESLVFDHIAKPLL